MGLLNYIEKNSDILTSTRDKNPLFYILVVGKMKKGMHSVDLETDFVLKQAFQKSEWLSKQLGSETVKILHDNWLPGIVIIKFEESTKKKPDAVVKQIFEEMRKYLMSTALSFKEALKIESAFKDYVNSKELEDYYASIH